MMSDLGVAPGQTIGPFFHNALSYPGDRELAPVDGTDSIRLHGLVFDGAGGGVPDAVVEIRQADPSGVVPSIEGSIRRVGASFTGWGRSTTDRRGRFWFSTLFPGPTHKGGAAFFSVGVFARGVLDRLFTRIYLPDQDAVHPNDPLLATLTVEERRRMIARRDGASTLRFDIHLQGPRQSIFLDFSGPG